MVPIGLGVPKEPTEVTRLYSQKTPCAPTPDFLLDSPGAWQPPGLKFPARLLLWAALLQDTMSIQRAVLTRKV